MNAKIHSARQAKDRIKRLIQSRQSQLKLNTKKLKRRLQLHCVLERQYVTFSEALIFHSLGNGATFVLINIKHKTL